MKAYGNCRLLFAIQMRLWPSISTCESYNCHKAFGWCQVIFSKWECQLWVSPLCSSNIPYFWRVVYIWWSLHLLVKKLTLFVYICGSCTKIPVLVCGWCQAISSISKCLIRGFLLCFPGDDILLVMYFAGHQIRNYRNIGVITGRSKYTLRFSTHFIGIVNAILTVWVRHKNIHVFVSWF